MISHAWNVPELSYEFYGCVFVHHEGPPVFPPAYVAVTRSEAAWIYRALLQRRLADPELYLEDPLVVSESSALAERFRKAAQHD